MSEPIFDRYGNQVGNTNRDSILQGHGNLYDQSGQGVGQFYTGSTGREPVYDRNGIQVGELFASGAGSFEGLLFLMFVMFLLTPFVMLFGLIMLPVSFYKTFLGRRKRRPTERTGFMFWVLYLFFPYLMATFVISKDVFSGGYSRRVVIFSQIVICGSWFLLVAVSFLYVLLSALGVN